MLRFLPAAAAQPQRVAPALLHLVPALGRVLCSQHVCGGGRRELPQVSGEARERGEGAPLGRAHSQDGRQVET